MAADMTKVTGDESSADDKPDLDVLKSEMAIHAGTILKVGQPVHEMLTLAALINSDFKLDPSMTYRSLRDNPTAHPEINDFIRGVIWNDDPECKLFKDDNASNNLDYSSGTAWGISYQFGGFTKPELIHRSHYGDLQWLHAMALGMDQPAATKASILQWIEIMYSVATGVLSPDTPLVNTELSRWFDDPAHYTTVGQLLTHRHPSPAFIPHRAVGSCFHVIQDSYAIGHTSREKPPNAPAGEADRWGAVLNFHSYGGQVEDQHKHFDHSSDDLSHIDLRNPNSWNGLLGCREGLDKCITLANFWHRKAPWKEVYRWLDDTVFAVSPKATASNNIIQS
ncbi:uncharacterized protein Z520_05862 [Fonsecaea multimorphosa CBS 102226]|uniref:Uncharacterized protein n=1 Tax=Fonsecaea multimorphosa CBS 102226 TaxID=1442371 RepID=A0A0D2INF6_9EURO|nr:uncharacterized protein Z520_05862 [Fonsecaea multimorphosa CBS 102226]KIX98561.1 hypothetical protein Z520_05862 [Fonsecaea multimorphosa CBS 102226]OAL24752.1 hypothetical protein AYO22_05541 [Fonsecaea multimorphosa]